MYGLEVENITSLQLFQQTINEKDPVPSLQELLMAVREQNVTHRLLK